MTSVDHDGRQQQQRPDLGRGLSRSRTPASRRCAATSTSATATSRRWAIRSIAGRGFTWNDVHTLGECRAHQREPRARVLGRAGQGDWASASGASPKIGVVRNRRRRRQRAPGWRDQAGADDRLLADDDRRQGRCRGASSSSARWRYAIRSSRLQSPGFLGEVQQAVWSVNPNLPLARVRTMQQIYDESMAQTQFVLVILGIAASVTLLLGLVGIYGVIAYIVVAAPPRSRHPHGARRAGRIGAAHLRHARPVARRRSDWRSAWSAPRR